MSNKFSDYNSLLDSYTQLEKEFTKKCQQLSALKTQIGGTSADIATSITANTPPQISDLEQLIDKYPTAKYYSQEITELVNSPKYAQYNNNYLECYLDLIGSKSVPLDKLTTDSELMQQYVIGNSQVVDAVLQSVLSGQPALPPTIAGNSGSMSLALPTRPKTIAEASNLAKNYFEK